LWLFKLAPAQRVIDLLVFITIKRFEVSQVTTRDPSTAIDPIAKKIQFFHRRDRTAQHILEGEDVGFSCT
jgi:hypothetical protein